MEIAKAGEVDAPYFCLELTIVSGVDLIAMDKGGVSDPYVSVCLGNDTLFKSAEIKKTTSPVWNEKATIYIESPLAPLTIQVYDKDVVGKDDFMGQSMLDIQKMTILRNEDVLLELDDGDNADLRKKAKKKKDGLGTVHLKTKMKPLTRQEYNQALRANKDIITTRKLGITGIVHVLLVQARGVMAMDGGTCSDPYCKVILGKEKRKSKTMANTLNPKWRESLDLNWFEELNDFLEIQMFDHDVGGKDDFMGRVDIDLRELKQETTYNLWRDIKEGKGQMNVIITISGTVKPDSPSNLQNTENDIDEKMLESYKENYKLSKTFKKIKDIGRLVVKVMKAEGLASADLGGTSDPFAVVEIVNDRVVTDTKMKTLAPTWQKVFNFDVKDINDYLEVTVYDYDKNNECDFLGKVKIPLLRVKSGVKHWYALKDKHMRTRAKGSNPQVLLECFLVWNPVRASVRTFNPKQLKYEDKSDMKFKFATFNKNVARVQAATAGFDPELAIRELQSILKWENKAKSAGAFVGFLLAVWFFEPWMVTFGLLIPFIQAMIMKSLGGSKTTEEVEEEEESVEAKGEEGEKKSIKEKMQAMQEIALMVQTHLGFLAHVLESGQNVFNFSVPFISWLGFTVLSIVTLVLYFVPIRIIIILWGTNKFLKKLFKPNAISNNELIDFISRVPDNEELKDVKEVTETDDIDRKTLAKMKKNALKDADII